MDVSSPAPPPVWQPPVVYGAQSQWAEDNTEAGNCIGCGCECDVAYLCERVSKELADAGNADQLTPLYIFTVIFVLLFVAGLAVFLPGFLQIEAEQAFILGIIEDRKANLAASGAQVANPVALAAAYSVPVPDVTPGMVVTVVVPEGMEPGQQMAVDPDGPEGPLPPVLVTIPEDKKAGDAIQVTCPAPVPVAAPIQAAVPMTSGAGMFMVQSKMPGPMGGQKMNVPGALGRYASHTPSTGRLSLQTLLSIRRLLSHGARLLRLCAERLGWSFSRRLATIPPRCIRQDRWGPGSCENDVPLSDGLADQVLSTVI